MHLTILYRGSLISCNYGCEYCPFAKRQQTAAELAIDQQSLERFVNWIAENSQHQFSILFTPWGEALIHQCYQQALVKLTQMPHVNKAAIQTNLSVI
jgi:sulfatase maturation enzyme AslB (radical SAM superfamily)